MAVSIRLRRIGRKKQPSYRVVVTDSSRPRDGQYIETLGFYNPRRQPAELRLDLEKVDTWVGQGAEMSETVRSLVRKARKGGDAKVGLVAPPAPQAAPAEPAAAEEVPAAAADAAAEPAGDAGAAGAE
jgi:small subunit ribosomal protein S16